MWVWGFTGFTDPHVTWCVTTNDAGVKVGPPWDRCKMGLYIYNSYIDRVITISYPCLRPFIGAITPLVGAHLVGTGTKKNGQQNIRSSTKRVDGETSPAPG